MFDWLRKLVSGDENAPVTTWLKTVKKTLENLQELIRETSHFEQDSVDPPELVRKIHEARNKIATVLAHSKRIDKNDSDALQEFTVELIHLSRLFVEGIIPLFPATRSEPPPGVVDPTLTLKTYEPQILAIRENFARLEQLLAKPPS